MWGLCLIFLLVHATPLKCISVERVRAQINAWDGAVGFVEGNLEQSLSHSVTDEDLSRGDNRLCVLLTDLGVGSKTYASKICAKGLVEVNGELAFGTARLSAGDEVIVKLPAPRSVLGQQQRRDDTYLDKLGAFVDHLSSEEQNPPLSVVHEDSHLVPKLYRILARTNLSPSPCTHVYYPINP